MKIIQTVIIVIIIIILTTGPVEAVLAFGKLPGELEAPSR